MADNPALTWRPDWRPFVTAASSPAGRASSRHKVLLQPAKGPSQFAADGGKYPCEPIREPKHRGSRRESVREQGKNDEPAQSQEAGRKEEGPVEPAVRVAENIHVVREGVADLRDQRCPAQITPAADMRDGGRHPPHDFAAVATQSRRRSTQRAVRRVLENFQRVTRTGSDLRKLAGLRDGFGFSSAPS